MKTLRSIVLLLALFIVACQPEQPKRKHTTKQDLIAYNQKLVKMDSAVICHYCYKNNLDSVPNKQGLWITVSEQGIGNYIQKDNIVTLSYSISDLRGNIYYTSQRDGKKVLKVGQGTDVMALDMALPQLRNGAKATLIVMPDLAYGLRGDDAKIEGRMILRYDIEVLSVE